MIYINDVIEGIATVLYKEHNYPVYVDEIKSDAEFPCFVIETLSTDHTHLIGDRYERRHDFDIMLFIKDDDYIEDHRKQINPIIEQLYFDLEYITLSDNSLLQGEDMSYRITDGILHFKVSYTYHIRKVHKEDPMQSLTQKQEVKHG